MSNLVLYRKYRPQTFSEFIGQEHIVKTITNSLKKDNVSHAYLFSGPRGSGKTTLARLTAKAVNCENKKKGKFEPCNKCSSCIQFSQGQAMDLIEIDAASQTGVDDIRDLKEGIRFVPSSSKFKVFIIDEVHQLSKSAANALLKTLEEPPVYAIFILATTEIHKMIPTVISRCQRHDFRKLKTKEIIEKLDSICKKEKVKIEKSALELIAENAHGSLRDAEGLLDQVFSFAGNEIKAQNIKDILGLIETSTINEFINFVFSKNQKKAIKFLHEVSEQGIDLEEFTKSLVNYLRQGLILKIAGTKNPVISGLTDSEIKKLDSLVKNIEQSKISQILEFFLEAGNRIRYSPIPQLAIELAIIDSCEIL